MPSQKIILQGVTKDNHLTAVKQILAIPNPERIIISVAFLNESGLSVLHEALTPVAEKTTILAGIRNGITSAQGLLKSLEIGCLTYGVDTGSRTVIFHPKIYFSRSNNEARLIIGSANLTIGGLNSNIEASLLLMMELGDPDNATLIEELEGKIDDMIVEYNEHVFTITNNIMIKQLLDSGRVIDECLIPAQTPAGSSSNPGLDTISRIKLKTQRIDRPLPSRLPARPRGVATPGRARLNLVWESAELMRRDLNIPTSKNTNPTGSMLLKRGNSLIDQQTYFRAKVFDRLAWRTDPQTAGKELAEADFQIVIRSLDYGVYRLTITHDTRTNTISYKQRQPMSALRWGIARPLIARADLLNRKMRLYRDGLKADTFIIEID